MNRTVCPKCGTPLNLTLVVEGEPSTVNISDIDVLARFTKDVKDHIKVEIEGNFAKITLTGKYNKQRFMKANIEVKGYGGRWVKGHFLLPLAGMSE